MPVRRIHTRFVACAGNGLAYGREEGTTTNLCEAKFFTSPDDCGEWILKNPEYFRVFGSVVVVPVHLYLLESCDC